MGTTSCEYVSWEEVFMSNDKGRREVHYLLKRRGGGSDLAVLGKEKSLKHMSYRYAIRNTSSFRPYFKLRSRREVVNWLDSIVSDSSSGDAAMVGKHGYEPEIGALKDNQLQRMRNCTKEFSWIGLPWACKKRRKHYQAYKRNGFQISVHDFIFVLAEEDKRLVAYLEDLYEDSKGNKMVVVRWFHKIDEVGIALPHSFSDREVFFSLYLQDLSIECIDGLAFVLSPGHYEKFQNEARCTHLEPFICNHQFDNDDVKPFDITQIKGYWKQEILRYMYTQLDSKSSGSSRQSDDDLELDENHMTTVFIRPKKRLRLTKADDAKEAVDLVGLKTENVNNSKNNTKINTGNNSGKLIGHTNMTATIKGTNEHASHHLVVGSLVEVLSQDGGMRGCWFRASVIKKNKDKVKVQYQDIQDAVDETKKLEEWVLASRIAVPDNLGLRMRGRTMVRPAPPSNKRELSWVGDVGFVVDAWWHDGWWEGIVVQKDSESNCHVYFPGEKVVSVFGPGNLRESQDWVGNEWVFVRERPDLVASVLSSLKTKQNSCKSNSNNIQSTGAITRDGIQFGQSDTCLDSDKDRPRKAEVVPDLLKNVLSSQLRWKTTRKRKRGRSSASYQKPRCTDTHQKRSPNVMKSNAPDSFLIPASLKVDHDDCKYVGDPSIFSSSVVPSLTNMVMCR
ncbi:hypothetical protein AAZX31_01G075600 [Glycine max]|uniref:BAH domain-containing protein n=1 Tax=Glycine soja TaxID=3848 RepID=A0A445M0K5_GLYSO|nr:agenet and bromo-adjacent homology domain-containing protein [Glycine max]XP_028233503.1 uncharacterized protein LOC114413350 [Glycine soja]KAH1162184.1 hypothetical protein GYH30_000888 [Glycine max]KAH1265314.1 DUF724 domain-containing protein 3 [Glycine max]KAH1265316.1 DUF724 domain-containing protein 3 [Glycine max]KRH75388.2 hypothetical protein GLYMA_01G082400v4 [Glycine max]RZC29031.1 hypothetical protein D0Y65_000845 [Glycine soja]